MGLVYEQCGNCRRRGAYVVAGRGLVRCKYCTASAQARQLHPSNLAAVAAGLHSVAPRPDGRKATSGAAALRTRGEARIAGGVMSMDLATISVLAGSAKHRDNYPDSPGRATVAAVPPVRSAPLAVVVDDDAVVRGVISASLERGGITVIQAGSGTEACEAIVANLPDLVLLDLSMPGMDGLEVLVELRRRYDMGIMVVSGRANAGDQVIAQELGADDFMEKPFAPVGLLERANAVMARRARPSAVATG